MAVLIAPFQLVLEMFKTYWGSVTNNNGYNKRLHIKNINGYNKKIIEYSYLKNC